jgi:DNA-binding Lrp family transcriptional regulator
MAAAAWRSMKTPFSKTDIAGRLAAALEEGLPLSPEPFGAVADSLGVDQDVAVSLTKNLLRSGFLRRFGAFWNFSPFRRSYLFGAKAATEKLEQLSIWINGHDSVTHNYLRDHELNLWFTAIFQDEESALLLSEELRSKDILSVTLATVRRIKLCPRFAGRLPGNGSGNAIGNISKSELGLPSQSQKNKIPQQLHETQRAIITVLQGDLKPKRHLYREIASRIGLDETEFTGKLAELKSLGILRRVGASVNHYAAGFAANSLMAFDVSGIPEDETAIHAKKTVSEHPWASHCYMRRVVVCCLEKPWRHSLFVMIHAENLEELAERERLLAASLARGDPENVISMRTLREYKKSSFNLDLR